MNSRVAHHWQGLELSVPVRYRPGMRYGHAPEDNYQTNEASRLSKLVFRLYVKAGNTLRERKFKQSLEQLNLRIETIQSLSMDVRNEAFSGIRNDIKRFGYSATSLIDALAYICVYAEETLSLSPHQGQCRTALALLTGQFVELPTGEGKTLATALAASVAALDGSPVHVLTSNEYLAERDANYLRALYSAVGLSSAFILSDMNDEARHSAYCCDIVHLTGKQSGFDWMRDKLAVSADENPLAVQMGSLTNPKAQNAPSYLQRGLCVGILDEADSMLLDEARTPLVLASAASENSELEKEASVALGLAQLLSIESDFERQADSRSVILTEVGKANLDRISNNVSGVWRVNRYRNQRVSQALAAIHMWRLDQDYIVLDGRVQLVDEQSGRALPDRRLQHGLQVLLELKEHCKPTPESTTVGSIAFQNFFLRYMRLVGTSGTLVEASSELTQVYNASLMKVGSVHPSRLLVNYPRVFTTREEQLEALILEVREALGNDRPVLIGTRSVEQSVGVGAFLKAHRLPYQLLNASQSADEASLIAAAGVAGQVTVATNMAGRGTDIPLGQGVSECGGLHLISLAFNESARVDRQLVGRVARHGQPGSFSQLWTLEDDCLAGSLPSPILKLLKTMMNSVRARCVVNSLCIATIRLTQRRLEWSHRMQREKALSERSRITRHTTLSGQMDYPV